MWLSAFCATLVFAGFGCEPQAIEPEVPLSITATVRGNGRAGILVVQVIAQEESPHAQVEVALPDGVSFAGVSRFAEADLVPGKTHQFRFPIRAASRGTYIIGIKAMAGEDSYRFGRSISVAWIAQAD